jgi:hypothetical protein
MDAQPGLEAAACEDDCASGVEALNAGCFCAAVDEDGLRTALEAELGSPELHDLVRERCPHVFAARPVFVDAGQLERMRQVMAAMETVAASPAWQEAVLSQAPAIARHDPGARGAFFGYDFHVAGDRLGLIEINTNAGGAMLNAVLARAHRACCLPVQLLGPGQGSATQLEASILAMFHAEWRLAGRTGPLRTLAIVDERPQAQYLYPEFLLFERLFRRAGLRVVVADPSDLQYRGGRLFHGDLALDLVYNRLTDFYLEQQGSAALRAAYLEDAVVLTPHPRAHALFADKRHLARLSDPVLLRDLGVARSLSDVLLPSVPRTVVVGPDNAAQLWTQRKGYFFKPFAGYGGRAAYRGDKLTYRVWQDIAAGGYVAQEVVAPGERALQAGERPLKFDLRNYAYGGQALWVAARLYQGQTTNFRTPGGGFAPVYRSPF